MLFRSGTVDIWFLMTDLYENGIPQQVDIDKVMEHINKVRPVTATVTAHIATALPVDIEIANLSPDTTDVRAAIEAEIKDLFAREMRVSTQLEPFTVRRSKIWEAISQASGEYSHTLNQPAGDISVLTGGLPVPGGITYV